MDADEILMDWGVDNRQGSQNKTPHGLCFYRRSSAFIGGFNRFPSPTRNAK
jgi:hypothetical protein